MISDTPTPCKNILDCYSLFGDWDLMLICSLFSFLHFQLQQRQQAQRWVSRSLRSYSSRTIMIFLLAFLNGLKKENSNTLIKVRGDWFAEILFYKQAQRSVCSSFFSAWKQMIHDLKVSTLLYVGNLSFYTTEEMIFDLFQRIGPVKRVIMGINKYDKTPCGFCFVE
jgi:hypothetical protein